MSLLNNLGGILPSILMVAVAVGIALVTLRPRLIRAPLWRATVTPLASIIGSGFLVAGPVLSHALGNWAWLGMAGLCGTGYLFGAAIRRNIVTVEPMLAGGAPPDIAVLERLSDFALAIAYFVSVTYYLTLLASFALRIGNVIDPTLTRVLTSAVVVILGVIGLFRGLRTLEQIEASAVGVKLALIGGLLAALALASGIMVTEGTFALPVTRHLTTGREIDVLLGLVILVQGFETSRYLGSAYDPKVRVKTMQYAQWLSTIIYVIFILLMVPFFTGQLPPVGGETQIIDLLKPLGVIVGPLIIVTALASQLSAAVADMNGAGGLLESATRKRVPMKVGYIATAAVALVIIWTSNVFEIIVYASKAFVIYYGLQCALALVIALHPDRDRHFGFAALFAGGLALAAAVLIFGVPAEGG